MLDEAFVPLELPVTYTYLCHAWGSAYRITRDRNGWSARRKDGRGTLTATDPKELLTKIRADYFREPVRR